jgi:hypothetical protein
MKHTLVSVRRLLLPRNFFIKHYHLIKKRGWGTKRITSLCIISTVYVIRPIALRSDRAFGGYFTSFSKYNYPMYSLNHGQRVNFCLNLLIITLIYN